jgi:hypothetical protein
MELGFAPSKLEFGVRMVRTVILGQRDAPVGTVWNKAWMPSSVFYAELRILAHAIVAILLLAGFHPSSVLGA